MISKVSYNSQIDENQKRQIREISRQVETVFLTEMLKVMLSETSITKNRTLSTYMTVLIPELASMMAQREIGIGKFLTENPSFLGNISINSKIELTPFPEENKNEGVDKNIDSQLSFPKNLSLPVNGKITSKFGLRFDPIDGKIRHHNGIDIAVPEGTKVSPVLPGKVVYSGYSKGYGNCVVVEHEGGIQTLYAHNSKNLVKVGDTVTKQTVIALSGSTGRTTGPHLHFEIRIEGKPVNPFAFLNDFEKTTIT